jgi:hypothetical protein
MKFALAFAAVWCLAVPAAAGKESAEEERRFLDGLRTKGYAAYALQYLEKLQTDPKLPPDFKASLQWESAKTKIILAEQATLDRRVVLYAQARAEMEKYVAANPGQPLVVRVNQEIARIASLQGKAQLSTALRQETVADRNRETRKARRLFEAAAKPLASAVKALNDQMAKYKGALKDADKQALEALEQEKLEVEFDQALNLLLQAQTYVLSTEDADAVKQGKLAEEAENRLRDLSKRDENNPLCAKAQAWLIPCALTSNEPKKALDEYTRLKTLKLDNETLDGKLLGDYFHLSLIANPVVKVKNPLEQLKRDGRAWLKNKSIGKFGHSPGGYGVWIELDGNRYCFVPAAPRDIKHAVQLALARACVSQADAVKKKKPGTANRLYREAQTLLTTLDQTDNDLGPVVRNLNLDLFAALRAGKDGKVDVAKLHTFRDYYLLARYETRRFYAAQKQDERTRHLRNVATALQLAREHAGPRQTPRELGRVTTDLADIYLTLGESYRAAVLGDHLARVSTPSKETARAAGFALQAYLDILHRDQKLYEQYRDQDDPILTRAVLRRNLQADRAQFQSLAQFVEQQPFWQDDNVAQFARYQRALLAIQDNNLPEAVDLLEGVKPSYAGFGLARCQLVLLALRLTEDGATRPHEDRLLGFGVHWREELTEAEQQAYLRRAVAALEALPPLTPQASAYHFHLYFVARLKQCRLLYKGKKFTDLAAFAVKLLQEFKVADPLSGREVEANVKKDLQAGIEIWSQYAKLGQAELEYANGNYDKVLAMTGPKVEEIKQKIKANVPGSIKDFLLTRDLLELALRADVQKNNRAGAREVLDLLQRIAGDTKLTGGPTGIKPTEILVRLVLQLKAQVQELRAKGKPAEAALAQTVANFSAFLDDMTKDLDKLTKDLDKLTEEPENGGEPPERGSPKTAVRKKKSLKPRILGLLAKSYASLDKHQQAADLLSRITPPVPQGKKPVPPDELHDYLEAQLLYAQELRKASKLDAAQDVLKRMGLKPGGKQTLDLLFLAFGAEKERIRLLEDSQKFGLAYNEWTKFIRIPRLRRLLNDEGFHELVLRYKDENDRKKYAERLQRMYEDLQQLYFDALYHRAYSLYKYGQGRRKPAFIRKAAGTFLKFASNPDAWKFVKQPVLDLLKSEPQLKQEYDALKKAPK